jgi:hypothetical protein
MTRRRFHLPYWLVLVFSLAFLFSPAAAQNDPISEQGIKPYGAYHGGNIDVVSLVNGKLDLHAPLFSYPQRGKLHLGFTLRYTNPSISLVCVVHNSSGGCLQYQWFWGPGGMQIVPDIDFGWIDSVGPAPGYFKTYSLITADGASHELGNTGGTSYESLDATAMHFDLGSDIAIDSEGIHTTWATVVGSVSPA